MRKYYSFYAPPARVSPGSWRSVDIEPVETGIVFKPQSLVLTGFMKEIRGSFWVKRSRLPSLDRDDVFAFSTISRYPKRRRTVISFTGPNGRVARTYLPSSVEYDHVDPLSYITVSQIKVDDQKMIPSNAPGVPASVLQHDVLGAGIPFPTSKTSIKLEFYNRGDVQVEVYAAFFGFAL